MKSPAAPQLEPRRLTINRVTPLLGPQGDREAFARAVREGLLATPKRLPFCYFYDEAGSALFEQICTLPEYYLTRTEDAILKEHAAEMVAGWTQDEPPTLVELGSGSAEKTRRLIAAAVERYGRLHYVPIDVSRSAIEESARELTRLFPGLRITALVGDYHDALADLPARFPGPKLVAFLGSSLGNYATEEAAGLLSRVGFATGERDRLLLGTDLVKGPAVLEPAYDDSQGVTARFNSNLLARINRELRADFVPENFAHRAFFRHDFDRVEMHLVSLVRQTVTVPGAGMTAAFAEGESIHTENSHKYTADALRGLAARTGFREEAWWEDGRRWFRVQRWQPLSGR